MAIWPVTLPQKPQRDGLLIAPDDVVLRSRMDTGPPKVRAMSSLAFKRYTMSYLLLSSTIVGYLNTFYDTTLTFGTDTFTWDDPISGTSYNWQFAAPPKLIKHLGGDCWLYSVVLDRLTAV